MASRSILDVGEVVADRFLVEGLADRGGMGAVYRARDRETGQELALKLLLDESSEERFAREARLLSSLRHPRIVRYLGHGTTERGAPYLAMEWLEGADLRSRLVSGRLTVRESLSVIRGAAEALAFAHERGIVHRDVNPRNLFLGGGDVQRVKVLDFGIARPLRATFGMTLPGTYLGTPGYMAPEQARGSDDVDARADVFSLGCVLYECLTGVPAFVADNLMALLSKVLFEDAPRLSERGPFAAPLDGLVARMLAKKTGDRPRNGTELSAELAALGPLASDEEEKIEPGPPSLTNIERRLVCVVMAAEAPPLDQLGREGGTLASSGTPGGGQPASLARFGASLERLADGSLVGTLVGEGDATDHAARAARFALALRDHLPDVPIVLATGRGVVTGRIPVGEVLDRAAKLLLETKAEREAMAAPKTAPVRLDDVTAGLLDLRFHIVEENSRVELRGARDSHDVARHVLGRATSCVGRDRDLRTLEATFDECVEESVARAVLVTAPAGFGKTRLRREFLHRRRQSADEFVVMLGRGDAMSAGAPFALIAQTVTGAAGIADGEPLPVRRQKLSARVGKHVPPAERARIVEFLGELVGAPFPEEESVQLRAARQDPVLRGDQMRRAYEDWLQAECAEQPVLLVLEDLHWGDLPSVKIVDALLRNLRNVPFMVLASGRPEVHELFPELWTQRGLVELHLMELTPKASEKLAREVLGETASDETVRRIVEAAAGNPFCLEELLRAEAEGRREETPGSVLAVVSARIERLEPNARRLLRAASVFGGHFWGGAVASLLGGARGTDTTAWLEHLSEREVIVKRGRGNFPGEDEYAFRHALVREAAYAMLVGEDRVLGHRLAGAWLEEAGERDALTLAEHFDRGQAPERAVAWYRRAAEQALEGNDLDAATRRSDRAIELGADGAELAALLQIKAEAYKWRGANAEAAAVARLAMAAAAHGSDAWLAAAGEVVAASGKLGERDALADIAQALLSLPAAAARPAQIIATARAATQLALSGKTEIAEQLLRRLDAGAGAIEDLAVAGFMLEARAVAAGAAGDPGARVRLADAAAESFEAAGDLRNACLQRVSVGYAYCEIGAYAEAERALRGALVVAERMGIDNAAGTARAQLGRTLSLSGQVDEACDTLTRAIESLRAQKNMRLAAVATRYLAQALYLQGDWAGAEAQAKTASLALASAPAMLGDSLAMLARAQRARGELAEALESATRAMQSLDASGKTAAGEAMIRLEYAEALFASGDAAEAKTVIATAKERVLARAKTIGDAELRRRFLEAVAENARTLALALAW